jgi:muramoyltetrapeptide carboxypeptidase
MRPLFPSRLRPGDLIGLVSPASAPADLSRIERGVVYLEKLGYRAIVGAHAGKSLGYLAGTDEERLADFHAMVADPDVRAILCTRGGYGTPRILDRIDYGLVARSRKILVGYSDITALLLAVWKRTGLVTFHGPMLGVDMAGTMDPYAEENFWRLLTSRRKPGRVPFAGGIAPLVRGRVEGRLLGGNFSLVQAILGTPFQPNFRGSLLFLEDIGEEPYRIDRMFAHLRNAGILKSVAGIVTGQFTDCGPRDPGKPTLTLDEVLAGYATSAGKPFLAGASIGHEDAKATIPVGIMARLDVSRGTLSLLEPAVC